MKARYCLFLLVVLLFTIVPVALSQDQITLHVMSYDTTNQLNRDTAWFDAVLKKFEADHPGVTVEVNSLAFPQYGPALETMISGKELPDVFYGQTQTAILGRAGLVIDFRDYVDQAWLDRFYAGPLKQTTFDGAVYGVPQDAQFFEFFVNPAVMDPLGLKPPVTWDDLIAMAPKISAAGYIPLAWGNSAGNVCPDFFLPLVAQFGGDTFELDDLAKSTDTWNSEPVIKALDLLDRLTKAGVFMPGINGVSQQQGDQVFYQGKSAMLFEGSWIPVTIGADAPEELVKTYTISKIPALTPDGIHWAGDGSGESWAVKANSPNTKLSVELVKYLLSDDVYKEYVTNTQSLPSMPSAAQYLTDPKVLQMADWLKTDGTNHILFGQGSWQAVSDACTSILEGSATPADAAAKIQADVLKSRGH